MTLDPSNYSPDTVALNPELFGKRPSPGPGNRAVLVEEVDARPKQTALEQTMRGVIDTALSQFSDITPPETEYRFAAIAAGGTGRGVRARLEDAGLKDWRFDFAWPDYVLAIEVEGGTWTNGRHTRAGGFEGDCEKYNEAALDGWMLLRFTGDMIKDGRALEMILRALRFCEASL